MRLESDGKVGIGTDAPADQAACAGCWRNSRQVSEFLWLYGYGPG